MSVIRKIAKKIREIRLKPIDPETVFTRIYHKNEFGGRQSVSGPGSDLKQTKVIRRELPRLTKDFKISSMLDIPCGDFNWMRRVDLDKIQYLGADIVKNIIGQNKTNYKKKNIHFYHLNLIKDSLPKVGLVLCRDCLVHFSYHDIFLALKNICLSGSTYLLTTIFTGRTSNCDINTGAWRPLNLVLPPFNLPKPIEVINEKYLAEHGKYRDKSLGLWRIKEIASRLDIF